MLSKEMHMLYCAASESDSSGVGLVAGIVLAVLVVLVLAVVLVVLVYGLRR